MKTKPYTTSLEISKKLYELYPKAKTEYIWYYEYDYHHPDVMTPLIALRSEFKKSHWEEFVCPTWQVHELLDIIPETFPNKNNSSRGIFSIQHYGNLFSCWYTSINGKKKITDVSFVEALGKLAIWIKIQK